MLNIKRKFVFVLIFSMSFIISCNNKQVELEIETSPISVKEEDKSVERIEIQEETKETFVNETKENYEKHATLVFCGDAMAHMPQVLDAYDAKTNTYIFDDTFSFISEDISKCDYAQVNFETVLQGKEPKGFPDFSTPDEFAFALKNAGFDLLTTANNHAIDGGYEGLKRTKTVIENLGLDTMGTYRSKEEYHENEGVLIKNINGINVAFICLTSATNGRELPKTNEYALNVYTTDYKTKLSKINYEKINKELNYIKQFSPDFIIAIMHWGVEYKEEPSKQQKELAQYLKNKGVQIIIGSHPHVLQHFEVNKTNNKNNEEVYKDITIFSMGNFTSCQMDDYTNVSSMAFFELYKNEEEAYVEDFYYKPITFIMRTRGKTPRFFVIDSHSFLNNLVSRENTKLLNITTKKIVDSIKDSLKKCHSRWDESFDYYIKNNEIYYDDENTNHSILKDIYENTKKIEKMEETKVNWGG